MGGDVWYVNRPPDVTNKRKGIAPGSRIPYTLLTPALHSDNFHTRVCLAPSDFISGRDRDPMKCEIEVHTEFIV